MKETEGLYWVERLGTLLVLFGIDGDAPPLLGLTLFAVTNMLYVYVSWLSRKDIKRKFPQPLRTHVSFSGLVRLPLIRGRPVKFTGMA